MRNTNQTKEKPEIDESSLQKKQSCKELVLYINEMIKSLRPSLSPECCIYKVPENLRKRNEAAYTPQVVSIGPFHHGKKTLKDMENHKLRYVDKFLHRKEIINSDIMDDFVSFIKDEEVKIREYYSESFDDDRFKSGKFVKMIVVDAAFIIELFLRTYFKVNDFHFMKPWLQNNLNLDLMLLENQIPYFVLEKLYDLAFASDHPSDFPSLLELTVGFFSDYPMKVNEEEKVKHFTDLLRSLQLPKPLIKVNSGSNEATSNDVNELREALIEENRGCNQVSSSDPNELLEPLIEENSGSDQLVGSGSSQSSKEDENSGTSHAYSTTELREAGVKFTVSSSKCLLDIEFTNGELKIPRLKLFDDTESFLRNLMALEQCHYPHNTDICRYIWFMDYLNSTGKDVDLLVQEKIIVNWLGDNKSVANLFNKLCLDITLAENEYFFVSCKELNEYYETTCHKWKANLRLQYFSNPWIAASTIAAIVLLVLTLIQTICSIIAL